MARSSRFQILTGAAVLLLLFLVAVWFASRQTFREHAAQIQKFADAILHNSTSGLGLSGSYGSAQSHGGTRFYLELPAP